MTPVLGNLHLHLSYLWLVAHRAFGFCNKYSFFHGRVISPLPNPQPGGPARSLFVWPLPSTCLAWVSRQEYKTPANIALGATGAPRPPHHDKVTIPIEAVFQRTREHKLCQNVNIFIYKVHERSLFTRFYFWSFEHLCHNKTSSRVLLIFIVWISESKNVLRSFLCIPSPACGLR